MQTYRKGGDTVRVVRLHGGGAFKRSIMDMGITKGVEVYVRKLAPLGRSGGGERSGIRAVAAQGRR